MLIALRSRAMLWTSQCNLHSGSATPFSGTIIVTKRVLPSHTKPTTVTVAAVQKVLVDMVWKWLESGLTEAANEAKNALLEYLNENFGGWGAIVRQGVRQGLDAAVEALRAVKDELVTFCHEHRDDIRQAIRTCRREPEIAGKAGSTSIIKATGRYALSEVAEKVAAKVIKQSTSTAIEKATVGFTKKGATLVVQKSTKLSAKGLMKVAGNPFGIAADLAQAGLEISGHQKAGKTVGLLGNMASGAMIGGVTFGPPGAFVGAVGSLVLWGGGEVVGSGVERMINWAVRRN